MNSKILILAFIAFYQVTTAQRPSVLPAPSGTGFPLFLSVFNSSWTRPYFTAAAEGWDNYFEQLEQARKQVDKAFSNFQNGDLQPPRVEAPTHDLPEEIQIFQTVTRPQIQGNIPEVHPQQLVTVAEPKKNFRHPQSIGLEEIATAAKPISSQISFPNSESLSQVSTQMVPQIGAQISPEVAPQVPSWVGK